MTPPIDARVRTGARPRVASSTVEVDPESVVNIAGPADENLRVVENAVDADLLTRGNHITIRGEAAEVSRARRIVQELITMASRGSQITPDTTRRVIQLVDESTTASFAEATTSAAPIVSYRGKSVRPKTLGQREYVDAIDENTVVLGIGLAGTGKTYLAMAKAVQALMNKEVHRIILTRPAVEAGEKLGFLPGTLGDKIDPYLRPLHDALREMVDPESIPKLMETGVIEVAPLAYMRGRTLNGSFVILDEAQNTTPAQMKMFLTRLGFGSKMVVTGDLTQVDLPGHQESGLGVAQKILHGVDGVHIARLDQDDVVRHHLVSRIVSAYENFEAEEELRREDEKEKRQQRSTGKKNT
ncbi:PhoH family protein [uncultured Corynebacterium sp.]|uniref:PhoH family protein n=1 Tax=uncultured Corynebacterium sp. TaxID=159447 RepID=UPI00259A9619|nr:PhoH family protein [uncultured Corynebacterium sp.]